MRKSLVRAAVEVLESRRLLSAGDLDPTFGIGGRTTVGYSGSTDDGARAVAVLPDGKLLVAGESYAADSVPTFSRYLADGRLDSTFGDGGRIRRTGINTGGVLKLVLNGDGSFLALAGTNVAAGLQPVTRYLSDGGVDPTWVGPGTGIVGRSLDLVALGDGTSLMLTTSTLVKLTANGTLDTTFGAGTGKVVFGQEPNFYRFNPTAAAVQSSGKIVVAGERQNLQSGAREMAVRRFNGDGTLDTTFANSGQQLFLLPAGSTAPGLRTIAIQPSDQKIILGGTNGPDSMAIRLLANGGADQGFGANGLRIYNAGGSGDAFNSIVIQSDGKYLFGGTGDHTASGAALPRPFVARLTTGGLLDTTYAGDGVQELIFPAVANLYGFSGQIALDSSGRGVLVGQVTESTHRTNDQFVARLTTSGQLDTTFDGDGKATADFEGPQYLYGPYPSVGPDGSIVMGGSTRITAGAAVLAKLRPDGALDFTFPDGGNDGGYGVRDYDFGGRSHFIWDTAVQNDGKIIAVGRVDRFDFATSWDYDALIARFEPDGTPDYTFGDGFGYVLANLGDDFEQFVQVAVQNDGKILARGQYRPTLPGEQLQIVARYLPDGTPDPDFGGGDGKLDLDPAFTEGSFGDMLVTRSGKILLGGIIEFDRDWFLQQLNADGTPDTTFGTEDGVFDGAVRLGAIGVDGQALLGVQINPITDEILVAGTVENDYSDVNLLLTKLTRDGALVSGYGTDGTIWSSYWNSSYRFSQFVWTPDDKVLLGGTYQRGGSDTKDVMVMRLLPDTTPDSSFANGMGMAVVDFGRSDDHAGIALRPDGSILAFSDTDAFLNGPTLFGAARLQGDARGSIRGMVFNDVDGDGVHDSGESFASGRTVYVDLDNDAQHDANEPSAPVTANGYAITIAPGTYLVRMVEGNGWSQSSPADGAAQIGVVQPGGQTFLPEFGAHYDYAAIIGHVFEDIDGDGNRDSGEGPLVDRTVYLDANNNGAFDASTERFTVTDTSGNYRFNNVLAGSYRVRSVPFSQWIVTAPGAGNYVDVQVGPGSTADLVNFGHRYNYGSISGNLFNDANGNGVRDTGEPGIVSRFVFLDNDNDGVWDSEGFGVPPEPGAMTDGNGNYTIPRLQAGSYRVRQVLPTGWRQTAPVTPHQVSVAAGQNVANVVFGAVDNSSSIAGFIFNDLDGDGVRDSNETNWLTGRTVWLDTNNNGSIDGAERTHVTNDNFFFGDLAPGAYYVRATLPAGWQQTVPANNAALVVNVTSQSSNVLYIGQTNTPAPARIAGFVFDDTDADGLLDAGENALLPDRLVFIDADNDGSYDAGERSMITQRDGYWFDDLAPGTYVIRHLLNPGWAQTSPANNGAHVVTVASGQRVLGRHFGTRNPQTPYQGAPFAVGANPLTIQAEDYDLGGQGIAYSDIDTRNDGGQYRPGDGVDIMSHGTGLYRIGGPKAGEWMEYTIDVAQAGDYEIEFRVSQTDAGAMFHAEIDGLNVTGSLAVPDTNGFSTFTSVKKTVTLSAGQHVLRFAQDVNAANGYAAGIDWIKISPANVQPPATSQGIVVSPDDQGLSVPEGGSASFTVKLAAAPTSNVTVTISKQAGSEPDVNADKSSLTFTAANWNVAQTVTISAAEDGDAVNNHSFFSVSSPGLTTITVLALEADNDGSVSEPSITIGEAATVRDGTYGSRNYGTESELIVKRSSLAGYSRETYIKFDYSFAERITTAKLRLNARLNDPSIASLLTEVHSVDHTTWSETGVTWNNKPVAGATLRGSFTTEGTSAVWYEVDLTSFIQAEFAAGRNAVTLVLRNAEFSGGQTLLASDETVDGPQLVVG